MTALEVRLGAQEVEDRGDGPAVLWLGSPFGEAPWLPVHEALADRHRVVVPASPTLKAGEPLERIDSVEDYVLHLLDVLDALGVERAAVVGTSFGGWLAAELASFRPDLVTALALVAPMGLRVEGESPPELFTLGPGPLAKLLFADPRSIDVAAAPVFDREGDPMASFQRLLEGQEAMARLGWSPYLHDPKLPDRIQRWRGPSLLVWGEGDAVLGPVHAAGWGSLLGVEPEVVPGAGHLAAVEAPEVVGDLVGRFLRDAR